MNMYSRRRRSFLSLILLVSMVMTLFVIPAWGVQTAKVYADTSEMDRPDYAASINDYESIVIGPFTEGFTQEDAEKGKYEITVSNTGKLPITIHEEDFYLGGSAGVDDPLFEFQFDPAAEGHLLNPDESYTVGAIVPRQGILAGRWTGGTLNWGEYGEAFVIVQVVKNGASLVRNEENILDFGASRPGFEGFPKDVSQTVFLTNNGNVPLKIVEVETPEGPFADVKFTSEEDRVVNMGDEVFLNLQLDYNSPSAELEKNYQGAYVIKAMPLDDKGEVIVDAEPVVVEIPVKIEITSQTYTLKVDYQGYADTVEIEVLKGTDVYSYMRKAEQESSLSSGCIVNDHVLDGFRLKPLEEYNDENEYMLAADDLSVPIFGDMTVYAMWRPLYHPDIDLSIKAPVCGKSAEENAPDYELTGDYYSAEGGHWMAVDTEWGGLSYFDGTFTAGDQYYATLYLKECCQFPFFFSPYEAGKPRVIVNGQEMDIDVQARDAIVVSIPMTAQHEIQKKDAVSAACDKDGNVACWTCEGCGKYYSDKEGTTELEESSVIIPRLGHDIEKVDRVAPTCTEEGIESHWECTRCGRLFSDAKGENEINEPVLIDALGHSWDEWEITKEPTYSAAGEQHHECTVCHKTETVSIPKKEPSDGWHETGSKWYYYKNGAKATNQWIQSGGKWYYMKQDGAMADGEWVKSGGKWYHFNASGAMQTGWQKVSGSWYYFNGNGSMGYSEWRDGYWLNANGTWTYQPKGSWKKSGGRWWFGDTSGWYAKSTTIWIDGSKYSFDASGWLK